MPRRRFHRVRGGGLATECARAGNFFSRWFLAPRRLEHEGCPVISLVSDPSLDGCPDGY